MLPSAHAEHDSLAETPRRQTGGHQSIGGFCQAARVSPVLGVRVQNRILRCRRAQPGLAGTRFAGIDRARGDTSEKPRRPPVRHDPDKCWCIRCRLIEEKGGEPSLKDWREAIIKATVPGEKWLRDLRKEKRAEETTSADEPPQS